MSKNVTMVRTRFAPSPTGYLHIGGARTALFSWAFAKKYNGSFVLRIEDTDVERSTQEMADIIIQTMDWLGLSYDEGPYYQSQRGKRYTELLNQLLNNGQAYHCYCSKEELEQMREQRMAQGLKPKYDRRCLHRATPVLGVKPVIRFKNPDVGSVVWQDLVKGRIEVANAELDDLIIARNDGTPTYNFCVVVDDLDMQITHVVRGDDHVNNTPRQINILQALASPVPEYAHVPMILRDDGKKMSKRTDAVSVMQYKDMGILPEALLNYLARLCWGHGNEEVFTLKQFVQWFELDHVSPSAARFDMKKLYWLNKEHMQITDNSELAHLLIPILRARGVTAEHIERLKQLVAHLKNRVDNLNSLADECRYFYQAPDMTKVNTLDKEKFLTAQTKTIVAKFIEKLATHQDWQLESLKLLPKEFCAGNNIKMPELGMPLRLMLCGTTSAPALDVILFLLGKETTIQRLQAGLHAADII